MKRILAIVVTLLALGAVSEAKPKPEFSAHLGVFYSSLSSYGEWINCDLGYVWRPSRIERGWRPYLYGRWVWTDYGWYWVSDEPYGWATFHYGRWYYDDYYGWIWIPDDVWGPAWVEWRYDDDYVGWSPLPPAAVWDVSVGITFTNRWVAPYHYWSFVPCRNFTAVRVVDYVQPVERTRRIIGTTRSVVDIRSDDHRIVNRGVDVRFIERRGDVRVNRVDVVRSDRGGSDRFIQDANRQRIETYQPRLEGTTRGTPDRPANVRQADRPIRLNEGRSQGEARDRGIGDRQFSRPPAFQRQAPNRERDARETPPAVRAPRVDPGSAAPPTERPRVSPPAQSRRPDIEQRRTAPPEQRQRVAPPGQRQRVAPPRQNDERGNRGKENRDQGRGRDRRP